MRGGSHEPHLLDPRGSLEPLAAASDAARDLADRTDFRDRAVEWRAGIEPAGAPGVRPRGRRFRRRADGDAGRPPRWDLPAKALCRLAPRRLAGVARARRPAADRRKVVTAVWHGAGHPRSG